MSSEQRTDHGLVGVFTNADPMEFSARYLDKGADRLGGEIQRQYGLFNDPRKLAEFLLSEHWYWLVGADWSLPPMNVRECPSGPPEEGNPVGMGEFITALGSDGIPVEGFTQENYTLFADWMYLLSVNDALLVVYRKEESDWVKVDSIPLKPVPKLHIAH